MEPPLPTPGPQAPPAFVLQRPPRVERANKWSLFGSSLVILAFSLRLLGDKWEHQVKHGAPPPLSARVLTRRRCAGGAGGAEGGAGGQPR